MGILALLILRLLAIFIIPPPADEVIQLYMADDIAHFRQFPIYFYDQALMGTLESYYLAPFFKLFGFSLLGSRISYSLFYLSFMAMYLWVVRRLFNRELTAYLFILLTVLPFPALFFTTVFGWMDVPIAAILSLLLLLKMTEARKEPSWLSLGLGSVCGIALWCSPLFVIWLVPVGVSLVWLIPAKRKIRILLTFFLGLLGGLFPVWLHGLETGTFMSVKDRGGAGFVSGGGLPQALYLFFARMKYFFSTFSFGSVSPWIDGLIRGLSFIPSLVFLISFISFLFYFLRSLSAQKPNQKIFGSFMILSSLVFAVLYSSRKFTVRDEGIRFFLQLLIPYAFVVSWQMTQIGSKLWKKACLSLLLGVLVLGNIFSGWEAFRKGAEFRELIRFLEKEGLSSGIANIGVAYPLNALSRQRLTVTPLPHHAASDLILEKVKKAGPRFLILERQNPRLRKELENDSHLKRVSVGTYDIFYGESDFLASLLETQEPLLY